MTFEEGTLSEWLYEIIQPLADQVIVCNPRRNKLLSEGSKNNRIDTRKLADLLRTGMLKPVYHGQAGTGVMFCAAVKLQVSRPGEAQDAAAELRRSAAKYQ